MSNETQIPRRRRAIFRGLSVLTLVVGGLGFLMAAFSILHVPVDCEALQYLLGQPYPHSALFLYLIDSVNLLFNVMLFAAGTLLWKLDRRGLLLLICVLITEFIFVLSLIAIGASKGFSKPVGFIVGKGLLPFAPQAITAFPIVAGILVLLAYRYLRMPSQDA